ncbi:hypothetical protein KQI42_20640 [Tissierella sp. MSJ-40]|uniref:Uncharacterized protein n=1 Tax=Tissierella simiarum TaxID=2841534 RepID=A0ABS6ECA0_9FIRM|nr:hypothetical protein [Tissierella simiarum]MBU5440404.1 hypothetical protein [Tissierella simiarum]
MAKLENWQRKQGEEAIKSLAKKKIIEDSERWIKDLNGDSIPDWALWSMLDQISE